MSQAPDKYQKDKIYVSKNFNTAAEDYDAIAVLQKTVAEQLLDRLGVIRLAPGRILDLGSGTGTGARLLKRHFRKAKIVQLDFARKMLSRAVKLERRLFSRQSYVCADAQLLPFAPDIFDLTYSNLMLQWCNDPDSVFTEVRRVTRPGGLFIFSSFGPDTLRELRESWSVVDADTHVNVFMDMHDVGDALVRAGFENPVMEVEYFTLTYTDAVSLFRELKQLGASNTNSGRRQTLTGKYRLQRAIEAYEKFRSNDRIPATYEVVYGHAWRRTEDAGHLSNDGVYAVPVSAIRRKADR